jgi:hypothetical protein
MKIIGEWYCLGMPLINEEIKQGIYPVRNNGPLLYGRVTFQNDSRGV